MIRTVCLNPSIDKTAQVPNFRIDLVNRITDLRTDAGGKGINVSKVVHELGGKTAAYALLAGDTGHRLERLVIDAGIALVAQYVEGETRTNLKVVDTEGHTNTDINEPGPLVGEADLQALLDRLLADVEPTDTVVLAGSVPKGAPVDVYATWITAIKARGAKVFLDADGAVFEAVIAAGPTMVKPNDHELSGLVGRELTGVAEIAAAAREVMAQGVEWVTVSMGGAGALFVTPERTLRAISPKVEVGSTVGAGDSVVAAIAYAGDEGMGLEDTIALSMATGSATVMQSGTQAAPRALIDSLVPKVTIEEL